MSQVEKHIDYAGISETDDAFLGKAEILYPKSHWNYRIYRYGHEQGGGQDLHNVYYEHGKRTKYFQINFEG